MNENLKIVLVTNICAHYRIRLFELLDKNYDIDFYFYSEGSEKYWDRRHGLHSGDFRGGYLRGFYLLPGLRIVPSLIRKLFFGRYNIFIKCIGGRFALPLTFIIAKFKRKPFILWTGVWMHPHILFHKISFFLTKFIYSHSAAIVVYGEHVKRYLISLGVDKNKIFAGPYGIDNSLFNKPVEKKEIDEIRKNLKIEDKKVILFIGRLEEVKGLPYLLEAISGMDKGKVVLLIIGGGNKERELKQMCFNKNLTNILFINYVNNKELYKYHALADIFALPSVTTKAFRETWGVVINEAMNQGCPIVATDAVGAAAGGLVQNGINGLVVRERDAIALRDALQRILTNGPLRQRMSDNALKTIRNYTAEGNVGVFKKAIDYVRKKD